MNILRKARGTKIPLHAQRVFFSCDAKNVDKRDALIADLLSMDAGMDCVASYIESPGQDIDAEILRNELREGTQLLVLYVTAELLQSMTANRWPEEFNIARELRLPILPIASDDGLFPRFMELAGAVHGISRSDFEYPAKLKKQLETFLVTDEVMRQIQEKAFSATIFLSYRKKDIDEARRFMKTLHDLEEFEAVSVWYDNFLTAGRIFDEEIRASIDKSDAFVLLVTPNLLEKNDAGKDNYVVSTEYPYARRMGKAILPVEAEEADEERLAELLPGVGRVISVDDRDALRAALRERLGESARQVAMSSEQACLLGMAYLNGFGVERDVQRAVKLLEKAAGDEPNAASLWKINAATQLSGIYTQGIDAKIDLDKAAQWGNVSAVGEFFHSLSRDAKDKDITSMLTLGAIFCRNREFDKALELYESALHQFEAPSGRRSLNVAGIYSGMANVYYAQRVYGKALQYNLDSLQIRQELLEEDDPLISQNHHNIAMIYEDLSKFDEASLFYSKALEIDEKNYGSEHPETLILYNSLSALYYETGNYTKAIELCKKALNGLTKINGDAHPEVFGLLYNLAGYYWGRVMNSGTVIAPGYMARSPNELAQMREDEKAALDYALQAYLAANKYYKGENNPQVQQTYQILYRIFTHTNSRKKFPKWLSRHLKGTKDKGFFGRLRKLK